MHDDFVISRSRKYNESVLA